MQRTKKSNNDWVARILEIRASDETHVYARVYRMYWPDELPQGTHDGKKTVQGRQPYHGTKELVASNHSKQPWDCGAASARVNTNNRRSGYYRRAERRIASASEAMVRRE